MKNNFLLGRVLFLNLILLLTIGIGSRASAAPANQTLEVTVTDHGFEPKSLDVKPGTNVTLEITRKSDRTCATKVQIPSQKIMKDLPLNQKVTIALGVVKNGVIRYGCAENLMESAKIVVH